MIKILSTKYSHWRYEREVRCFVHLTDPPDADGLHFQEFGSELNLREIIVGSQSDVTRSELREAMGGLGATVSTFKARLSFKAFTVVRQRAEQMWT